MPGRDIEVTFRPLGAWPGQPTPAGERRSRYQFKVQWAQILYDLKEELRRADARDVVLQLALRETDIRRDGLPYGDARPEHPGVVLTFTQPGVGPVRYFVDAYELWEHNVRAITLTMEALRAVGRFGAVHDHEQFRGFRALPAAGQSSATMTTEQAAAWIAGLTAIPPRPILDAAATAREAVRLAAARMHPDRGGKVADFQRVQDAKRVLEAHHGVAL